MRLATPPPKILSWLAETRPISAAPKLKNPSPSSPFQAAAKQTSLVGGGGHREKAGGWGFLRLRRRLDPKPIVQSSQPASSTGNVPLHDQGSLQWKAPESSQTQVGRSRNRVRPPRGGPNKASVRCLLNVWRKKQGSVRKSPSLSDNFPLKRVKHNKRKRRAGKK